MNNTALGAVSNKKENIRFISEAHEQFYYEKLKEVRMWMYITKHFAIVLASAMIREEISTEFMTLRLAA